MLCRTPPWPKLLMHPGRVGFSARPRGWLKPLGAPERCLCGGGILVGDPVETRFVLVVVVAVGVRAQLLLMLGVRGVSVRGD